VHGPVRPFFGEDFAMLARNAIVVAVIVLGIVPMGRSQPTEAQPADAKSADARSADSGGAKASTPKAESERDRMDRLARDCMATKAAVLEQLDQLIEKYDKYVADAETDVANDRRRGDITNAATRLRHRTETRAEFIAKRDRLHSADEVVPPDLPTAASMKRGNVGTLLDNRRIYAVGTNPRKWTVVAILDGRNMLIREDDRLTIWVEGPSTDDLVDGEEVRLKEVFEVVGTRTYDSPEGRRTVRHLKTLDFGKHADEIKRRQRDAAKK
jgi:hypothetical protein